MRVLFDESMPRPFARGVVGAGHEVSTVGQLRWKGTGNGELLRRAASVGFNALLTVDRNLEYQQNVDKAEIGVVVLVAPSNRIEDLLPLMSDLVQALDRFQPGQVIRVGTEYWKDRSPAL